MFKRILTVAALTPLLTNCASGPDFDAPRDEEGGPTVTQVINKVQCEIAEAKFDPRNNNPRLLWLLNKMGMLGFDRWVAAVTLTLTVNDTAGLTPTDTGLGLAYLEPLKHAATSFAFGANVVLNQQRSRTYAQTYTIRIADLTPQQTCSHMNRSWHQFNLEGDLGLREAVYMGLHSFDADDAYNYEKPESGTGDNFNVALSFDVFKGVTNLGPLWTLVRFRGPVGGLGYVRDDLHKLAITFQPVALPPAVAAKSAAPAARAAATHPATTASAAEKALSSNNNFVTNQAIQQLNQSLKRQ